jgi:hypothetical protein
MASSAVSSPVATLPSVAPRWAIRSNPAHWRLLPLAEEGCGRSERRVGFGRPCRAAPRFDRACAADAAGSGATSPATEAAHCIASAQSSAARTSTGDPSLLVLVFRRTTHARHEFQRLFQGLRGLRHGCGALLDLDGPPLDAHLQPLRRTHAPRLHRASRNREGRGVRRARYADRENPMSSSITAPGPTGTLPGFGW